MLNNVKIRGGHDNFFTPLRLFFALMVVVGHSYIVALRDPSAEPFLFFHYKPSYLAVNLFFVASGFLVTKSMLYRKDVADYTSARSLRIYPALIAHVLFVMFIMGPFVTDIPLFAFFTDPQFLTQPLQVLSFYQTNMVMPGALTTNDEQIASGALWTLRYEVLAYIGTVAAFSLGLLKHKWMIAAQFFGFALLWVVFQTTGLFEHVPATVQSILRFGICYGLGAAIYAYSDKLSFNIIGIPVLGLVAALFHGTAVFEILVDLWLAYIVFWAAYVQIPVLNPLKKLSDISYGIYIYHWCLLQWIFYAMPELSLSGLLSLTLVATIAVSLISWHCIEKPMLRRKAGFTKLLKSLFGGLGRRGQKIPAK